MSDIIDLWYYTLADSRQLVRISWLSLGPITSRRIVDRHWTELRSVSLEKLYVPFYIGRSVDLSVESTEEILFFLFAPPTIYFPCTRQSAFIRFKVLFFIFFASFSPHRNRFHFRFVQVERETHKNRDRSTSEAVTFHLSLSLSLFLFSSTVESFCIIPPRFPIDRVRKELFRSKSFSR